MSTYITDALSESYLPELNNARIGHHSITRLATDAAIVTADTETEGFPAASAANELTYSYWQPTALPATWQLGTGEKADEEFIDYLGIAAHTLASTGTLLRWQRKVGAGAWETRYELDGDGVADDSPIFILDTLDTNDDVDDGIQHRIQLVSQTGVELPKIGVIYMGRVLKMQRALYGGHAPATLTPIVESRGVMSESGQFLGHTIIRRGMAGSWSWNNLTAEWYRENFVPFVEDFASFPAFIAWRPLKYPDEVAYIWRGSNSLPVGSNVGTRDYMSVTLNAEGRGGVLGDPGVAVC